MSNNSPDYENDLVFPPQEIKSQHELSEQGRQSDVLITAIERCEKLEKQLKIAVEALESLRTEKTVMDKVTGDIYYIWDYALEQIKELDK